MRRRILLLVIGMTTLVVLAFAIPIAVLIRSAVAQAADNATKDQARNVSVYLRGGTLTSARIAAYLNAQTVATGRPVSVTTPDGTVLGFTPVDNGEIPASASPDGFGHGGPRGPDGGGGDEQAAQVELRAVPGGQLATAISPSGDGAYFVRVYLSDGNRYAGASRWYLLLGVGSLSLLLIGIGAGEVLTRRITRPLVRTADTAQRLSVGDTTARAPTEGPREVADMGKALNRLADRIDELIAEERETVADLSHRLRTPLTTLRLDAEALRDPGEADRVGSHVSELERTLTAVIRAARRPQREGRMPSCDATAVVHDRVEFWSALTDEQGRRRDIALPSGPAPVRAAADDLAAAVDALLENVVAHTPEGTAFSVRMVRTNAGTRLEIADDGPGIPEDADLRGRSDRGSTGLGLDIVRRCAESSGGSMAISRAPSGGALVTLLLGAP
jgi:signal transduction histidine kinase